MKSYPRPNKKEYFQCLLSLMKKEQSGTSDKAIQKKLFCGVLFSTVYRIVIESQHPHLNGKHTFMTPGEKRPRRSLKPDLDEFDKSTVRRIIRDFHQTETE